MADVRIVKSCLSERLRAAKASGKLFDSSGAELGGVRVSVKSSQTKQAQKGCSKWGPAGDIGSELQAIFSGDFNSNQTTVFGCSPPPRSSNPLSRDRQFRRVVLVNPNVADRKAVLEAYAHMMPKI